jgi:hypothetical protein
MWFVIRFFLIGAPSLLLLLGWPIIDRAMYEADCRNE